MADVFLTYARKDMELAQLVVAALDRHGVEIFWDASIEAGASFGSTVHQNIMTSAACIAIWTTESARSKWIFAEANLAFKQGKLISLYSSGVEPPLPFNTTVSIELREDDTFWLPTLLELLQKKGVRQPRSSSDRYVQEKPAARGQAENKNKGYAFISHVEEDAPIVAQISTFLRGRGYGYWTYHESDRDYQKPTILEIEERMVDSALMLTVISPEWKRSDWTQRELAFAREARKPLFHLRFRNPGPTLAIAGDTYFDFERDETDAFRRLGLELDKKGL